MSSTPVTLFRREHNYAPLGWGVVFCAIIPIMTKTSSFTATGMILRLTIVTIAWAIWCIACFLPAYDPGMGSSVDGWTCFIFGPSVMLELDSWPWIAAWVANITMLFVSVLFLTSKKPKLVERVAFGGGALSLLVLGFGSLQLAAYLWIVANLVLGAGVLGYNSLKRG